MSEPLRRNPNLVWREEPALRQAIEAELEAGGDAADRGWVLLVDAGRVHELNLLAGDIWCLADGTRDAEGIARELAARYDAPPEEILSDVGTFVADCCRRGWLQKG